VIIRNDDISPSTDLERLYNLYECIGRMCPEAKIISGVTLFGVWNNKEAVYPDLPLKTKSNKHLYKVNRVMNRHSHVIGEIASHGMFHVKHSQLSKDAQEMSIVGSCNFLNTDKFIAPFNDYNEDTVDICAENKIELLTKSYYWKSMEHNKFDSSHKYWYLHSWRYSLKQLREYLSADLAKQYSGTPFRNS
jgi:hypothetical protein